MNDAVHHGEQKITSPVKTVSKFRPSFHSSVLLAHAAFQLVAVVVDQPAGQDHQPLPASPLKQETLVEEPGAWPEMNPAVPRRTGNFVKRDTASVVLS